MSNAKLNPDLANYSITATPVMVTTGTEDRIEPVERKWTNKNILLGTVFCLNNIKQSKLLE